MARTILKTLIALGVAVAVPTLAAPASAQRAVNPHTPAIANSAQRRAILAALRPAIERRLGTNIEFRINRIQVREGWALVIADPQRRGGGRIDWARHYSAAERETMDGLTINAILRFRDRRWVLVDHAIGPTDVWYCGVQGPPRALTGC